MPDEAYVTTLSTLSFSNPALPQLLDYSDVIGSMSGLYHWHRADQAELIGGKAASVPGYGGTAGAYAPPAEINRPALGTTAGGRPTLLYGGEAAGAGAVLELTGLDPLPADSPFTFIGVVTIGAFDKNRGLWGAGDRYLSQTTAFLSFQVGTGVGQLLSIPIAELPAPGTPMIIAAGWSGEVEANAVFLQISAAPVRRNTPPSVPTAVQSMRLGGTSTVRFLGDIPEALIFDEDLTAPERQADLARIGEYLAAWYGIDNALGA